MGLESSSIEELIYEVLVCGSAIKNTVNRMLFSADRKLIYLIQKRALTEQTANGAFLYV